MMKRIGLFAAMALLCLLATACPEVEPEEEKLDVTGQWQLNRIDTKVQVGDQTVEVYVAFNGDGTFELFQMLGTGRYRRYTGNWTLNDKLLDGSYTGGESWASSYEISMDANRSQLVMTATNGGDVLTYRKQTIPDDVRNNALEP